MLCMIKALRTQTKLMDGLSRVIAISYMLCLAHFAGIGKLLAGYLASEGIAHIFIGFLVSYGKDCPFSPSLLVCLAH